MVVATQSRGEAEFVSSLISLLMLLLLFIALLLEIGVLLGVAGWVLERDIAETTPARVELIGKKCLFGADSTANGCSSSR